MPPLGEQFIPQAELSEEELANQAEIEAKITEVGQVMQALAPPVFQGRGQNQGRSVAAHYGHPALPEGVIMEAYVRRSVGSRGEGEYVELMARPVYVRDGKAVAGRATDRKAVTGSEGTVLLTSFFSEGISESLGHAQRLEYIEEVNETLQLILEAQASAKAS